MSGKYNAVNHTFPASGRPSRAASISERDSKSPQSQALFARGAVVGRSDFDQVGVPGGDGTVADCGVAACPPTWQSSNGLPDPCG